MIIKKGTILKVTHSRKGVFNARAICDFDTEKEEFYPVVLVSEDVKGLNIVWTEGEQIPCRASLCKVQKVRQ